MAVEAVILDLDGTLIAPVGGTWEPVPGVLTMLDDFRKAGVGIAVATTHDTAFGKMQQAGIVADVVLTRRLVGAVKGNQAWVDRACTALGVRPHQLVWLGDSPLDMRSALNADVIYFNAGWSTPDYQYGITLNTPELFTQVICEVFRKTVDWFWSYTGTDAAGRRVLVRAIVDGNGGGDALLARKLRDLLKEGNDSLVGPISLGDFSRFHLLASMYSDRLIGVPGVVWVTYPGSKGAPNAILNTFALLASMLFRDRFIPDLLDRHTPATDMSEARVSGVPVDFLDQVNTVRLNPAHRNRILDKRVVVVDDFTTEGYSFECARNLLLLAGAAEVVCVCVGRYGFSDTCSNYAPVPNYSWDPFQPTQHRLDDFRRKLGSGTTDRNALAVFKASYEQMLDYVPF
ncbi:MAG: HAD hydrolase-like protein [Chloroflexota bacterium]|nr:HAD hydrolase-like protein [Chloroflexota bacterium]